MGWSGHAAYVTLRSNGGGGSGAVFAASRFVAVRHKLEIVEASSGLPKSIEAVVAFCGTIQCEVLSSSVTNETAVLSPSGSIAARVAPPDLNRFLDFAGKQGKIAQHSAESEDKTAAVVDVEAKLKNQTDFRDSLRKMLIKPGVSVADLLQIQEKLAEAQAELDSEAMQRKILANETEKVYVEIAFRAEQRIVRRRAFAFRRRSAARFRFCPWRQPRRSHYRHRSHHSLVDRDHSRIMVPDQSRSPVPGASACCERSHTTRVV